MGDTFLARLQATATPPDSATGGLSGLSPGLMEIAAAFFNAIAAVAALATVILAIREARGSRAERSRASKRELYGRVVLDPLVASIRAFVSEQMEGLSQAFEHVVRTEDAAEVHAAVIGRCKAKADSFNRGFFQLRTHLRGSLMAWGDEGLSSQIDTGMQRVQDEVIDAIHSWATANADQNRAPSVLSDQAARVMGILVAYDPTTRDREASGKGQGSS